MPMFLTDEQVMLADTARPFLAETAPVAPAQGQSEPTETRGTGRQSGT